MDLQKKTLQGLRRVRDKEKLSMRMLFTMLAIFREVHAPWIPETDIDGTAKWFLGLTPETRKQLVDDAMGVTHAKNEGYL